MPSQLKTIQVNIYLKKLNINAVKCQIQGNAAKKDKQCLNK